MKVMHEFDRSCARRPRAGVGFKFYAGGVQGDENDVVRKACAESATPAGRSDGVGLGAVAPEARVLDAAACCFATTERLDAC